VVVATPHRLCHHKRLLDYTSVVTPLSTIVGEESEILHEEWTIGQIPPFRPTRHTTDVSSWSALYDRPPVRRKGTTL